MPPEKYQDIFAAVLDYMDGRIKKFQLHSTITALLPTKHSSSNLIDILLTEFPIGGSKGSYANESSLRNLMKGHSEASMLARNAMDEVEAVVALAQSLGVVVNALCYI